MCQFGCEVSRPIVMRDSMGDATMRVALIMGMPFTDQRAAQHHIVSLRPVWLFTSPLATISRSWMWALCQAPQPAARGSHGA